MIMFFLTKKILCWKTNIRKQKTSSKKILPGCKNCMSPSIEKEGNVTVHHKQNLVLFLVFILFVQKKARGTIYCKC